MHFPRKYCFEINMVNPMPRFLYLGENKIYLEFSFLATTQLLYQTTAPFANKYKKRQTIWGNCFQGWTTEGKPILSEKKEKTLTSEPYIHAGFLPKRFFFFFFRLQHKEEKPKWKAAVSMKEAGRNKSQSFWAVKQEEEGELYREKLLCEHVISSVPWLKARL